MQRADAKLFRPIRVGNINLVHRIVMSPMTRFRADDAHVPTDIIVEYYAQRASVPGTLLITEATFIAARAGGYDSVPGIWNDEQVAGWKKVTDAVHAQGRTILVSSSNIPLPDKENACKPHPLTHEEILEYIDLFGQAAHNAVHRAGFDGVEVHSAHGYLIEQFLQDTSNKRTDQWGGSVEGRTRFVLEVVKKVVSMAGEE
ncbi:hypothetical protein ACEPAF_5923 [Sanghuangporus sanghuang]